MFKLFINYLLDNEIKDSQTIEINLEDVDYSFEDYKDLYNYVNKKIDSTKINVIDWLLNEK